MCQKSKVQCTFKTANFTLWYYELFNVSDIATVNDSVSFVPLSQSLQQLVEFHPDHAIWVSSRHYITLIWLLKVKLCVQRSFICSERDILPWNIIWLIKLCGWAVVERVNSLYSQKVFDAVNVCNQATDSYQPTKEQIINWSVHENVSCFIALKNISKHWCGNEIWITFGMKI